MKTGTKVVLVILGVLAVLLAALAIAAPHLAFNFIFSRPSRSTKVPAYYMDSPHYKASQPGLAVLKSLPAEDVYITSRDGLKLHAYFYPADESKVVPGEAPKFVVGIHGYRSYSRPEFGPYVDFYRSLGYNILLPDDRAHAPSEGEYIGFGVLDRLDCVDWTKYVVDRFGDDVSIMLHGVSMGAATVVSASGEPDLPQQVMGVVSDCGFTGAWDILHFQLGQMHLPADYLIPRMEKLAVEKAGFNFHEHTAVEQVKNSKVPMLFVQGAKDEMVPAFMAQELYDACPTEKRLMIVDEAAHGESVAFAPDEYFQNIHELFGI